MAGAAVHWFAQVACDQAAPHRQMCSPGASAPQVAADAAGPVYWPAGGACQLLDTLGRSHRAVLCVRRRVAGCSGTRSWTASLSRAAGLDKVGEVVATCYVSGCSQYALRAQMDGQSWRQALLDMFTGRYLWRVGRELYDSCARTAEGSTRPLHTAAVKAA